MWGLALAAALHAVFLYVMLTTTLVAPESTPADMRVQFIPPPPPQEKIIEPPPPDSSIPQIVEIQPPVVNVAIAQLPPSAADEGIDDVVEVAHQNYASKIESVSRFTSKPKPISMKHGIEEYPAESIRAKEAGRTMLKICISTTGTVESVSVVKSSGFPRLDKAAVKVARDYRFKPALRDGEPVPACMEYGIVFSFGNLHPRSESDQTETQSASSESTIEVNAPLPTVSNPNIGPITTPVPIRTYLKILSQYGVACSSTQLRVVGQDIHDHRYVVEAQCKEQPKGLVVFLPLSDDVGKFEMLDCEAAAKRQIVCEFETGK